MIKGFTQPTPGYRVFRMHQLCLLVGASLGAFGIHRGTDLIGLAGLITAVTAPIAGFSAYHSVGQAKAASNGTETKETQ